jgi:hypothetical protein
MDYDGQTRRRAGCIGALLAIRTHPVVAQRLVSNLFYPFEPQRGFPEDLYSVSIYGAGIACADCVNLSDISEFFYSLQYPPFCATLRCKMAVEPLPEPTFNKYYGKPHLAALTHVGT